MRIKESGLSPLSFLVSPPPFSGLWCCSIPHPVRVAGKHGLEKKLTNKDTARTHPLPAPHPVAGGEKELQARKRGDLGRARREESPYTQSRGDVCLIGCRRDAWSSLLLFSLLLPSFHANYIWQFWRTPYPLAGFTGATLLGQQKALLLCDHTKLLVFNYRTTRVPRLQKPTSF